MRKNTKKYNNNFQVMFRTYIIYRQLLNTEWNHKNHKNKQKYIHTFEKGTKDRYEAKEVD